MDEAETELIEVYSAGDLTEAYFLRDRLEEAGIKARVVGDALVTGAGVLPVGEETAPRIWVFQPDETRARELLAEYEQVHRRPHTEEDETPAATWKCPTCGEDVESDFDVCWNCQTPRNPY